MKKRVAAFLCIFPFLCMCFIFPASAAGSGADAAVKRMDIAAEVKTDGSLSLSYDLTYYVKENINGLYLNLADSNKALHDVSVKEVDGSAQEIALRQVGSASVGENGVFELGSAGDSRRIKLYRPAEKGESMRFKLSFTIDSMAQKGADTSVLYYYFIGKNWEIPIENLTITTRTEIKAKENSSSRLFVHCDAQGNYEVRQDGTFLITAKKLLPGQHLEARVLFPKECLGDMSETDDSIVFADVVSEEEGFRAQAEKEKKEAENANIRNNVIVWTALAAEVILLIALIVYCRKPPRVEPLKSKYYWELPEQVTPAQMAYLWRKKAIKETDISAMLLYFKSKGYVTIEQLEAQGDKEKKNLRFTLTSGVPEGLSAHETNLLRYLFHVIGDEQTVTLEEIRDYAGSRSMGLGFNQFVIKWEETVRQDSVKLDYFERSPQGFRLAVSLTGAALAVIGLLAAIFGDFNYLGVPVIALGAFLAIYPLCITRRTKNGEEKYQKWWALRSYLLDYAHLDQEKNAENMIWDVFLPYASVMGITDQLAEEMARQEGGASADDQFNGYSNGYWMNVGLTNHLMFYTMRDSFQASAQISDNTTNSSLGEYGTGGGFGGGSFGGGGAGASGGGGTF